MSEYGEQRGAGRNVSHKMFRSISRRWESLMDDAAALASQYGPEQVVSISISNDGGDGLITVWFCGVPQPGRTLQYRVFRSIMTPWAELIASAAAFVDQIGTENVLTVSQCADSGDGMVVVWYWG